MCELYHLFSYSPRVHTKGAYSSSQFTSQQITPSNHRRYAVSTDVTYCHIKLYIINLFCEKHIVTVVVYK